MVITELHPAWLIAVVILLTIFRLAPHPTNATTIVSMALFASAAFSNRVLA